MGKQFHEVAGAVQALRKIYVETEVDQTLVPQLHRLFSVGEDGQLSHEPTRFTGGQETHGILYIAGAGSGKTTTIQRVLSEFAPLAENPETGLPRYVFTQVSSPATLKSLGLGILAKLGVETVSERAKVWDIWKQVRHRLAVMDISLLWIDEAHDMFRSANAAELNSMLKMLKSLMQGEHPVVLILSGTEMLGDITAQDPQNDRRFTKIMPRDLDFGVDNEQVDALVQHYAGEAGLKVRLGNDLSNRLIYAGRFRFGRMVDYLIHAIEVALMRDAGCLEMEDFAEAWAAQESCAPHENLFERHDWVDIPLDRIAKEHAEAVSSKSGSTRKAGKKK
jgi:hypothetical protein